MIWAYRVPTKDGGTVTHYGTPVHVSIPGKGRVQVVYQFGTASQVCAAVHYQSGRIIAMVEEHHRGYPEQRAQAACRERFEEVDPARTALALETAPVLNTIPSIVGGLTR